MDHSDLVSRSWNSTPIGRRPGDGYVDATAMCQANGRHLPHNLANARTGEYLQALSGSVGISTDLLRVSIGTGPNHLRGTWVHPRVAIGLARWISPELAVWLAGSSRALSMLNCSRWKHFRLALGRPR